MLHNPYKVVKMFEEEVAHYTGAPYAVSVNSCTNAIFRCKHPNVKDVTIPKRTFSRAAINYTGWRNSSA